MSTLDPSRRPPASYPWAFLLPLGDVFIAGPQKPTRRFDPSATPITDDPLRRYDQVYPARGVNMEGTAVLRPLKPPAYKPRVLIAGGTGNARLTWDAGVDPAAVLRRCLPGAGRRTGSDRLEDPQNWGVPGKHPCGG